MKRTLKQNSALHVFFQELSNSLNASGLDQRVVLKPSVSIPWTEKAIKETLWKPFQKAMYDKQSTTELSTKEMMDVYETLNAHLSEKFGVHIPWPSDEELMLRDLTKKK
jgi:hypothetical protein